MPTARPIARRSTAAAILCLLVMTGCQADTADQPASPVGSATTPAAPDPNAPTTSTPEPDAPGDQPTSPTGTVVIAQEGGCMMAGPNCLEWTVAADGSWTVRRTAEDDQVTTGTVDAALVSAVVDGAAAASAGGDLAGLPAGTCNGCADGIDLVVVVTTADEVVALDSVDQDFGADLAVFDAIRALQDELQATTDVEPVLR